MNPTTNNEPNDEHDAYKQVSQMMDPTSSEVNSPTPEVIPDVSSTGSIPRAWNTPSPTPIVTSSELPVQPAASSSSWQPTLPLDQSTTAPIAVVRVLSPAGVEYVFMTFTLLTGAVGLASALIALVNGKSSFSVLAFPVALLVVSVPLFAFFFLHLKKLELQQPKLKLDPSKRRSTQFTQIWSFVTCLFTLIGLVFAIFAKLGGSSSLSIGKAILNALCVLVVAGGILAYYWLDEHKS